MTFHIQEFAKIFDNEFCEKIIRLRDVQEPLSDSDITFWKDKHKNLEWCWLAPLLDEKIRPCIQQYLDQFGGLVENSDIELSGFGIIKQYPETFDSLHFDTSLIKNDHGMRQRPFVCLLYLNDNSFQGGQLLFPYEKRIIQPETGKVIIFPASYLFPHQVAMTSMGNRYFIRINYMLSEDLNDKDLDEWSVKDQGVQKF